MGDATCLSGQISPDTSALLHRGLSRKTQAIFRAASYLFARLQVYLKYISFINKKEVAIATSYK